MDSSGNDSQNSSKIQGTSQSSGHLASRRNFIRESLKCAFTCDETSEFFKHIVVCGIWFANEKN